ncbi:MAG: hypothetical protein SGCHY_002139, partial [Lobulomycetales sp.]
MGRGGVDPLEWSSFDHNADVISRGINARMNAGQRPTITEVEEGDEEEEEMDVAEEGADVVTTTGDTLEAFRGRMARLEQLDQTLTRQVQHHNLFRLMIRYRLWITMGQVWRSTGTHCSAALGHENFSMSARTVFATFGRRGHRLPLSRKMSPNSVFQQIVDVPLDDRLRKLEASALAENVVKSVALFSEY